MATEPFFASGFLPRHHPLAPNRLFLPDRTFVAMTTSDLQKHRLCLSFPAMATFCGSGDIVPGRIFVAIATGFGQTGQRTCNSGQAGNVVPGRHDSSRPKFAGCSSLCFSFIGSCLDHSFSAPLG